MGCVWDQYIESNSLNCSDYIAGGHSFVVAGRDRKIYIYDSQTNKLQSEIYRNGLNKIQTHHNRVFSLKAHPEDQNILISSGWDESVKIYDVR